MSARSVLFGKLWTQYKRGIIVIAVFILLCILTIPLTMISVPDINHGLRGKNAENVIIWDQEEYPILSLVTSENHTSARSISIEFWVNASYFDELQSVSLYYFNGTNGPYFNASLPVDLGSWNYRQYWTGSSNFYPDWDFNATFYDYLGINIPVQKGGSVITYELLLSIWNGTDNVFQSYGSNFTVIYSENEAQLSTYIHYGSGLCWSISFFLMCLVIPLIPWFQTKKDTHKHDIPEEDQLELSREELFDRSDYLGDHIQGMRTGAGIFAALGGGLFILSESYSGTTIGFFIAVSAIVLLSSSMLTVLLTFSSTSIDYKNFTLSSSLLPTGQSESLYMEHLLLLLEKKERNLVRIYRILGFGILAVGAYVLMGFAYSMLPRYDLMLSSPQSGLPYAISAALVFFVSLYYMTIALGPRGLDIHDIE